MKIVLNLRTSLFSIVMGIGLVIYQEIASGGNVLPNFKAPKIEEEVEQKKQSGSGSRANCIDPLKDNSIFLIVPNSETAHLTISEAPNLYFYIEKDTDHPLFVNLVVPSPGFENPVFEKKININKAGIQKITIPPEVKLEVNQLYLWQLGISCQNNPLQKSQVLRAGIKRVEFPNQEKTMISDSVGISKKVSVLEENGIWYDAVDLVYKSKIYSDIEILKRANLNF